MTITGVAVRRTFPEGILRAVVSVTFDDVFVVHDVKVLLVGDRTLVAMPNRKNADGSYRDVAHPIQAAFRQELEAAVLDAYEKALQESASEEEPTTV